MAWIELHDTLRGHPKTYALAGKLKIPQFAAVGLLACLWTWALNNAQDGDLSRFPKQAIARECYWNKSADALISALIACGWVDDEMHIHDWADYAGRLLDKREQNADRKRKSRACHAPVTRDVPVTDSARHEEPARPSQGYRTKPNRTQPNHTADAVSRTREDGCGCGGEDPLISDEDARKNAADLEAVFAHAKMIGIPDTYADRIKSDALVADYSADWLTEAIKRAGDGSQTARSWRYIEGILRSWRKGGGIDSGKPPDKPKGKTVIEQQYNQRDYGDKYDHYGDLTPEEIAEAQKYDT